MVKNQGDKTAWTKADSFEIVGNGNPTDSVLKETTAVSVTISISVQKRHSRILHRVLSYSRMKEMHRETEVPEERVPMEECFDGHEGLPQRNLHNSFCEKWHPPECLFHKSKSGCRFGGKVLACTSSG